MSAWKYTDVTRRVVFLTNEDDSLESCVADREDILAWVADGNTILPPDPPPAPTRDEADIVVAKAYPKLVALRDMSPPQIQAWAAANLTNLAEARDAITTLAIAVSVLLRRL